MRPSGKASIDASRLTVRLPVIVDDDEYEEKSTSEVEKVEDATPKGPRLWVSFLRWQGQHTSSETDDAHLMEAARELVHAHQKALIISNL